MSSVVVVDSRKIAAASSKRALAMKAIALPTVRTHLRQVYERLHVKSRAELARAVDDAPLSRTG